MYGFRPPRNRKHPGDPPPQWAPIGRAGRLALLGTVIVGIIIALVIMMTRTAGAADDTDGTATVTGSSSPGSSQRVEVRETGYAVTSPEDWVVEIFEEDSDTAILALVGPERFGPGVELRNLLVAWAPGGREREKPLLCTLVQYAPIDVTADEFLHEVFGQSDEIVVEWLHDRLSRVLLNPFISSRIMADDPDVSYVDHYAIGGDGAVAVLMCHGVVSHRDDWLSIAESFEFLPEEE